MNWLTRFWNSISISLRIFVASGSVDIFYFQSTRFVDNKDPDKVQSIIEELTKTSQAKSGKEQKEEEENTSTEWKITNQAEKTDN